MKPKSKRVNKRTSDLTMKDFNPFVFGAMAGILSMVLCACLLNPIITITFPRGATTVTIATTNTVYKTNQIYVTLDNIPFGFP